MSTEDTIRQFIADADPSGGSAIGADQPLIRSGVLDSMSLLRLVVFVEEQFGVKVADGELVPDNFETIERICSFIRSKRKAS